MDECEPQAALGTQTEVVNTFNHRGLLSIVYRTVDNRWLNKRVLDKGELAFAGPGH